MILFHSVNNTSVFGLFITVIARTIPIASREPRIFIMEFSLNVATEFAEFSNKNQTDYCIWTHYLLCKRQRWHHCTTKTHVTERILKLSLIHSSVVSQILWIQWKFCSIWENPNGFCTHFLDCDFWLKFQKLSTWKSFSASWPISLAYPRDARRTQFSSISWNFSEKLRGQDLTLPPPGNPRSASIISVAFSRVFQ